MTIKYKKLKCIDVTAQKSNKIEFLQRMVDDASTTFALATSKYNSFVEKAATFTALYDEAVVDLTTAEAYWKQFLQVESDINALKQTADESNLIAVEAFHGVKELICQWEDVTSETIKAAEAITLTSEFIQKRKASNPLISDDLVNDAIAAANKAATVVNTVIKALTDALSVLSSSKQATNTTELTEVYINLALAALLENNPESELMKILLSKEGKKFGINTVIAQKIYKKTEGKTTLKASLSKSLDDAKTKEKMALTASEDTNKELGKAKEEMDQAQAALETWQAALVAAETAVAG